MQRRLVLTTLAASFAAIAMPAIGAVPLPQIEVFKSPTCGCCTAWIDHLKVAGFPVKVVDVDDTTVVRRRHGLPDKFGSCHTGIVKGYVIEGHVPSADIKRLLAAKPAAIGLAVPGMPVGSPGMEQGNHQDPYNVLLIDKSGRETVFAHYPKRSHGD